MRIVYFTLLILESMWNQSTHVCIVSSLLAIPEKTNKHIFVFIIMSSKWNNMHRLWNNFPFSMMASIFLNHLHRDTLTIQSVPHGENKVPYYIFVLYFTNPFHIELTVRLLEETIDHHLILNCCIYIWN